MRQTARIIIGVSVGVAVVLVVVMSVIFRDQLFTSATQTELQADITKLEQDLATANKAIVVARAELKKADDSYQVCTKEKDVAECDQLYQALVQVRAALAKLEDQRITYRNALAVRNKELAGRKEADEKKAADIAATKPICDAANRGFDPDVPTDCLCLPGQIRDEAVKACRIAPADTGTTPPTSGGTSVVPGTAPDGDSLAVPKDSGTTLDPTILTPKTPADEATTCPTGQTKDFSRGEIAVCVNICPTGKEYKGENAATKEPICEDPQTPAETKTVKADQPVTPGGTTPSTPSTPSSPSATTVTAAGATPPQTAQTKPAEVAETGAETPFVIAIVLVIILGGGALMKKFGKNIRL